ncbi:hypothetical protein AQJ46_21750 [Streptomyces canus]|uniref:Uncharacterized protein n=1 Tax=Streptomyces canus TaxID=58343 RepID=A0A101S7Y2_9ACTN|nr:hypothetical protein AQJ46_21750 [Streptomyces canus]
MQLGSSPTTRPPARTCSASLRTVRPKTRSAVPSCPVEIQVSPQHSGSSGSTTRQPACSMSVTAASPMCGWKWLVKVSGQSRTLPRAPSPYGSCRANHCCSVSPANSGTSRFSTPAIDTAAVDRGGVWVTALTTGPSRVRPAICAGCPPWRSPCRSISAYSSSLVSPHQNRVPSYNCSSRRAMLSTTLP